MSESISESRAYTPATQSSAPTVVMALILIAALSPLGAWLWQNFSDQVVNAAMNIAAGLEAHVRSLSGLPF